MAAVLAATYELYAAAGVHSGLVHGAADVPSGWPAPPPASRPAALATIPLIVFQGGRDTTVAPVQRRRPARPLDRGNKAAAEARRAEMAGYRAYRDRAPPGGGRVVDGPPARARLVGREPAQLSSTRSAPTPPPSWCASSATSPAGTAPGAGGAAWPCLGRCGPGSAEAGDLELGEDRDRGRLEEKQNAVPAPVGDHQPATTATTLAATHSRFPAATPTAGWLGRAREGPATTRPRRRAGTRRRAPAPPRDAQRVVEGAAPPAASRSPWRRRRPAERPAQQPPWSPAPARGRPRGGSKASRSCVMGLLGSRDARSSPARPGSPAGVMLSITCEVMARAGTAYRDRPPSGLEVRPAGPSRCRGPSASCCASGASAAASASSTSPSRRRSRPGT